MFEVIRVPWIGIPTPREKAEFFETLRAGLTKPCLAASYRLVHDWHRSEECVQEAFFILWEKLSTLAVTTDMGRWLFATVRNRGLKAIARRAREAALDPAWAAGMFEEAAGNKPVPENSKRRGELARLLAALSVRERAAFVLKKGGGLSGLEIGKLMSCQTATIRKYVYRARRRLAGLSGE